MVESQYKMRYMVKRDFYAIDKYVRRRGFLFEMGISNNEVENLNCKRKYPVLFAIYNGYDEIRAKVVINRNGDSIWIDMPFVIWNNLSII